MAERLTVAQALVRFLAAQWTARDGGETRLFAGVFGIFGHGNVAGIGQALAARGAGLDSDLPYFLCRNEQAMVHTAAAYARQKDRLSTFACTTSIGPGATNLVTGAAGATINRLPVLLLPGDIFAGRAANPLLQELEDPRSYDISVNDCLRPVSRYWDRINRPSQLAPALLAAMRVLTDPAETGAVTLALPQDVQAEAYDWPSSLFERRVWHIPRPRPDLAALARAAEIIRSANRPLIIAGGGVVYSGALTELREFADALGIPVAETQAGKGALPYDHPLSLGAVGVTGTAAANRLARSADVIIGVGTRYSDFTTGSHALFAPDTRFVSLNIAASDAAKLSGVALTADAREGLTALRESCAGWQAPLPHPFPVSDDVVGGTLTQTELIRILNDAADPHDTVVCAAGSLPGDLHRLWKTRDPKGYHVEYGYSCMGYEIAGGLGVKLAAPEREVFVLVGDGSYLMNAGELVTAVAEGIKLIVVLVQNHGFASIGGLSARVGAEGLGTSYRFRSASGSLDGGLLPVDLAANAASLGVEVHRVSHVDGLLPAITKARRGSRTALIHVETAPPLDVEAGVWWDVPVAEVAANDAAREARIGYEGAKRNQRPHRLTS